MASDCGEYSGEIFVDNSGNYIGDFRYGMAIDAPLGFSRSQNISYGTNTGEGGVGCNGFDFWFSNWWVPPYIYDGCIGFSPTPLPAAQPNVPGSLIGGYAGLLNGLIVSDFSGPSGLEHLPAVELDGSGFPVGYMSWLGETRSMESGLPPITPIWTPQKNSWWTWQGWARAVPDANGYVTNCPVQVGYTPAGNNPFCQTALGSLTTSWQFFKIPFQVTYLPYPICMPTIGIGFNGVGSDLSNPVVHTFGFGWHAAKATTKGRVHFKCLHLYSGSQIYQQGLYPNMDYRAAG